MTMATCIGVAIVLNYKYGLATSLYHKLLSTSPKHFKPIKTNTPPNDDPPIVIASFGSH